ncbi:hypothetical protein EON83_08055 [bacterium]|nr:MAG: hypothetical protein EON83_08055 [bacterium]
MNVENIELSPQQMAQAWREVSKRVLIFKCVFNLGLLAILLGSVCTLATPSLALRILALLLLLGLFKATTFGAARYANNYRCPECNHHFLNIDANYHRNPMQGVSFFGKAASCQHCHLMLYSPKHRRNRA